MGFLETYFNLEGLDGEQQVCCPFPHTKADGTTYFDHNPSMFVNLDKRLWHCKSCGSRGNEVQMIAKLFNTTSDKALKFKTKLDKNLILEGELDDMGYTDEALEYASKLGMTNPDVFVDLNIQIVKRDTEGGYNFLIPCTWKNRIIDVRTYRPSCTPKVISESGAPSGLIVPYDQWADSTKATVICAGEKDMIVARSHGLNAITLTGGELATPLDVNAFKDRSIAICYDNDSTGRTGALRLASTLLPVAKSVRIVDEFHKDFPIEDSKEDITDWFVKYNGTVDRLKEMIKNAPVLEIESVDEEAEASLPKYTLEEAIKSEHMHQFCKVDMQILATADSKLEIPTRVRITKISDEKGRMKNGEQVEWVLTDSPEALFSLMGSSKESQKKHILFYAGYPGERGVQMNFMEYSNVFPCVVSDLTSKQVQPTTCNAVFLDVDPSKLTKVEATCYRCSDIDRGEVGIIVSEFTEAQDDYEKWELTEQSKGNLALMQNMEGSVADRVRRRAEAVRGLLGYEANVNMITAIDMCYHSVKEFNYGNMQNVRGYIDCLVIGESRVGKSDTAKRLHDKYNLGAFVSLAGTAATIAGIVGGSVKDSGGRFTTRAGVIPRNNGSILCFEELAKAEKDILKALTDVRSSGLARVTRISSGTVEMPASLRMLTLTNVRPMSNGESRPINAYSSGVEVVKDLIGTAEDIARYDYVYIQGDDGTEPDPLYEAPEPYSDDVLQDCIRWVWSRTADQIIWLDDTEKYLNQQCKMLNDKYPLHIKLFGTECWKKVARLAIACAGYTISTDEKFNNILVGKAHVDWAVQYLTSIYDNTTFNLRVVSDKYKSQSTVTPDGVAKMQAWYVKYSDAFDYLAANTRVDKGTFKDMANILEQKEATSVIRMMVQCDFCNVDSNYIYVTQKFRNTYNIIDKNVEAPLATT